MNTFGQHFRFTSFGESHGPAMGVVIDGCPAGVDIDLKKVQAFLERRRPGASVLVSARNEPDELKVLSGIFEDKTLGTPIAIIINNKDQRSEDYKKIQTEPRIGHADDVWKNKFGHVDHRGGGRSSGRETVSRVISGAIAAQALEQLYPDLKIKSQPLQIGPLQNDSLTSDALKDLLVKAKADGKSYGGVTEIKISNPPENLGQPVFKKIKSELASAFMSVGAVSGVSLGAGFEAAKIEGTEFHNSKDSRNYGGIRGGITTGEDINFQVAFKPTSTVLDAAKKGRHDPCVLLRAQVVLEAMAYSVVFDQVLAARLDRLTP